MIASDVVVGGVTEQAHHGSALVQEELDVAIWIGCQLPDFGKGLQGLRPISLGVERESLQQADLDRAPGASGLLGAAETMAPSESPSARVRSPIATNQR